MFAPKSRYDEENRLRVLPEPAVKACMCNISYSPLTSCKSLWPLLCKIFLRNLGAQHYRGFPFPIKI